jgi:hypothetical protein
MERNIKTIVEHFNIEGNFISYEKVITGHINDSYFIKTDSTTHPGYFLQWINSYIFKDIQGLMSNIVSVTQHLGKKLKENPVDDFEVLEIIPTREGNKYFIEAAGQYWRLYKFIDKTHIYNVVQDSDIAYEGGRAFGLFMSQLADLPAGGLNETIPDFHNMAKRLETFERSITANPVDRVKDIAIEIAFVKQRMAEMLRIPELINAGKLPMRITHNDTKFNNILFNENEHAICIVDLDTVMPGSVLFDFGDAIRTGANTAVEDEKDLSKVDINLSIYEAYTQGFISATIHTLTPDEISNLAFSARFMTFIIGLRFLTDFVDGDPYFRTMYPEHNLVRARVQFRLVEQMEKNADKMHKIVLQAIEA